MVPGRAAAVPAVGDREGRGGHRGRGLLPSASRRSRRVAARGRDRASPALADGARVLAARPRHDARDRACASVAVLLVAGHPARAHRSCCCCSRSTLVGAVVVTGQGRRRTARPHRRASSTSRPATSPRREQTQAQYNLERVEDRRSSTGGFARRGPVQGHAHDEPAYVPEQHTDFIFTVVGEELGFVGGAHADRALRLARLAPLAHRAAVVRLLRHARWRSACSRCSRSRCSRTSA